MSNHGLSLEIVRGREVGRRFALDNPETVLGNALAGVSGIDLAPQEGDGPRRMAARHALVASNGRGLALRDLDSPGGTFLNARRILPGQALPLAPGDLIQLGAIQLRVVESNGKPANPPGVATAPKSPFVLTGGTACRTWDDFLRVASQRWADLGEALSSGRVDSWLAAIGRLELIVARPKGATPDEHLDAWLAALPTTLPSKPELDVHPTRLVVRVTPGGGTVVRSVQVANVGHRLLTVRADFEPGSDGWARVVEPATGWSRTVVDAFDLPIEVTIPPTLPKPLSATLRVSGNGGERRVEVVLEAKTLEPVLGLPRAATGPSLAERLSGLSATRRLVVGGLVGFAIRLIVGLAAGLSSADATPVLVSVAIAFGLVAGLAGAVLTARRGGAREAGFGLVSGAVAGGWFAAIVVALCRAVEPVLGGWAGSTPAASVLWGLLGLGIAGASLVVVPHRGMAKEVPT